MKGTRKIYCGYGRIVCSLGTDVASVYEAIESGATRLSCMPDKTPVCKIDRASALWARWPDLTFVEKMLVEVLSDMQIKTGLQLSDSNVQLILSTTKGNISLMRVDPEQTCLWHLGDMLSDRFRCARKVRVVSCACISGVAAIVLGKRMIEQHRCDHIDIGRSLWRIAFDIRCSFVPLRNICRRWCYHERCQSYIWAFPYRGWIALCHRGSHEGGGVGEGRPWFCERAWDRHGL